MRLFKGSEGERDRAERERQYAGEEERERESTGEEERERVVCGWKKSTS
jgi:hypothetical protein